MNKQEYLESIKNMIEKISESKDSENTLKVIHNMVSFKMDRHEPEVERLADIFYFICGIMFEKGLSKKWNGY